MIDTVKSKRFQKLVGLTGLAALSLQSASSFGAGYNLRNQSASGLGLALSSEAVDANNAAAQFNNPALLSRMSGIQLSLGLNRTFLGADFKKGTVKSTAEKGNAAIETTQGKSEVDDLSNGAVIPVLAYSQELDETWAFGVTFNVPWASHTDYGEEWVGRYHAAETRLVGMTLTPAVSYASADKMWSVGFGLVLQQFSGELTSMIDLGSAAASAAGDAATQQQSAGNATAAQQLGALAQALPTNADGRLKFTGSGMGYGFILGTHVEIADGQEIGFSYRSPIKHELKGDAKFSYPTYPEGTPTAISEGVNGSLKDDDAEAEMTTPAIISLGYANRQVEDLNLFFNVTYTQWSVFDKLVLKTDGITTSGESTTRLDWRDSYYIGLGGDYKLNEDFLLRTGLAYEQSAATDEYRTPRTPDADRTIIALGTNYKISSEWDLDFSYAHYMMDNAKISLNEGQEGSAGRGDLEGELQLSVNVVMLQANAHF